MKVRLSIILSFAFLLLAFQMPAVSKASSKNVEVKAFAPRIRVKDGTSTNWGGYAVETSLANPQNNAVSDVKGNWVVPTLSCTSQSTYSSSWVGIDGYSDGTVEQTGTEHDCINGQPLYYVWYEMYPKFGYKVNLPVKAGDNVSAEVKFIGNRKFVLTLTNLTTGGAFTTTQRSNGQRQSAEWITEAPWSSGVLPLANFGTMAFSNASATLNGHTGTISDGLWQMDQITMTDSSENPKATPSSLSPDGSAFSMTWNSN